MAVQRQDFEARLHVDQLAFIGNIKTKYNIASEAKVIRIALDYLILNTDVHDTVFEERRCLRCE